MSTLDQVISSLNNIYQPQVDSVNSQIAALPAQYDAQASGLAAQQNDAFNNILGSARQRGLGFSGIPSSEQAQYTASTYLPALANLKTAQTQQQTSLTDALNKIHQDQYNQGQSIYQYNTTLDEQKREFDANQAQQAAASAASNSFSPTYGGYATTAGSPTSASAVQRKDGGFNYTNSAGAPISAAAYAAAKGLSFRDVLSAAAKAGDKGAQTALGFVGNDYGYDPSKITSSELANLYNSLVWGTGRSAVAKPAPIPVAKPAVQPQLKIGSVPITNPLAIAAPRLY
jgi:hypothetical protein